MKPLQNATTTLINMGNTTRFFIKQHQSEILTAISAVGTIGLAFASAKNTRTYDRIKKEEEESGAIQTKLDSCIVWARAYWPTLILTASVLACNVGSTVISKKKQASLLIALNALEKKFQDYKDVLYETNPDAFYAQEEEIKKKEFETQNVTTSPGETLFYDDVNGYYFSSSHYDVLEAMTNLNKMLIQNGWVSVYNYYQCLGIEHVLTESDKTLSLAKGWCSINEFESGMHEINWIEYTLVDECINGETHSVIRIMYPPEYLDCGRKAMSEHEADIAYF